MSRRIRRDDAWTHPGAGAPHTVESLLCFVRRFRGVLWRTRFSIALLIALVAVDTTAAEVTEAEDRVMIGPGTLREFSQDFRVDYEFIPKDDGFTYVCVSIINCTDTVALVEVPARDPIHYSICLLMNENDADPSRWKLKFFDKHTLFRPAKRRFILLDRADRCAKRLESEQPHRICTRFAKTEELRDWNGARVAWAEFAVATVDLSKVQTAKCLVEAPGVIRSHDVCATWSEKYSEHLHQPPKMGERRYLRLPAAQSKKGDGSSERKPKPPGKETREVSTRYFRGTSASAGDPRDRYFDVGFKFLHARDGRTYFDFRITNYSGEPALVELPRRGGIDYKFEFEMRDDAGRIQTKAVQPRQSSPHDSEFVLIESAAPGAAVIAILCDYRGRVCLGKTDEFRKWDGARISRAEVVVRTLNLKKAGTLKSISDVQEALDVHVVDFTTEEKSEGGEKMQLFSCPARNSPGVVHQGK